jgi:NDP-sugar pyrophosphorylase family protein
MTDGLRRSADGAKADLSRWPALILAAGLGSRLQPLSSDRAKPALPIAGTPLIERTLRYLRNSGVERVVVNLHHRADSITRLVGDGAQFGLKVRYSWETTILGSAGGPARAIPLLESDRFLIVNGDMLTDLDLGALAFQHIDTNALVTMAVIDGRPGYNGVLADDRGVVKGFGTEAGALHFIGVQAVNASVFAGISVDTASDTVHGFYPRLIAARPEAIRVYHSQASYFDIGSPRDYYETVRAIADREHRRLDRGADCLVAPDATLINTVLWDRVQVGAQARLTDCIVADDVIVPQAAEFSRCSLVMRDNRLVVQPFDDSTVQ